MRNRIVCSISVSLLESFYCVMSSSGRRTEMDLFWYNHSNGVRIATDQNRICSFRFFLFKLLYYQSEISLYLFNIFYCNYLARNAVILVLNQSVDYGTRDLMAVKDSMLFFSRVTYKTSSQSHDLYECHPLTLNHRWNQPRKCLNNILLINQFATYNAILCNSVWPINTPIIIPIFKRLLDF